MVAKTAKTAYVVMGICWQYNDEFYYTDDNDSGLPAKAFSTKAKAEKHAIEKNIEAMGNLDIANYGENLDIANYGENSDDITDLSIEDFAIEMKKLDCLVELDGKNFYSCVIPKNMDYDSAVKLMGLIKVRFFHVVEVPME